MLIPPTDLLHPLPYSPGAVSGPTEREREVVQLFEEFRNPLLRYVVSRGLSLHDGEEIIQETFLALFRHLQLGRSRQNLRGWIFRVAHNLALKQHHANRKTEERLDSSLVDEKADATANPEEQAAHRQRMQQLQAVLRALPEQDRSCLYLRAEGLRYREIAGVLGISLGAVSIALTRSLARMRRVDQR